MEQHDDDVLTTLDRYYKILKAEVKLLDKHLFDLRSVEEYAKKSNQQLRDQTNNLFMAQINLGLAVEYMRRAGYSQITAQADKKEI